MKLFKTSTKQARHAVQITDRMCKSFIEFLVKAESMALEDQGMYELLSLWEKAADKNNFDGCMQLYKDLYEHVKDKRCLNDSKIKRVGFNKPYVVVEFKETVKFIPMTSKLKKANACQLMNWKIIGDDVGLHWPEIDEDISLKVL